MSKRPFSAQFPRRPQFGDEVVVKGQLKADARVFSVNFILDMAPHQSLSEPSSPDGSSTTPCCGRSTHQQHSPPPFIAYHFKTMFDDDSDEGLVVQTWKNVVWQGEWRGPNLWLQDRATPFKLIFRFYRDTIRVFVDHTDQSPQYEFEYQVPLERIRIVELWDDVEFVEEVTFRFKNVKHNGAT